MRLRPLLAALLVFVLPVLAYAVAPNVTNNTSSPVYVNQGASFSYQIVTNGGTPTSYDAQGLPAGLGVNPATGSISGSATATGTFNVTLSATNADGTGTATLTMNVTAANAAPTITSAMTLDLYDDPNQTMPHTAVYSIDATGSPTSWTASNLPGQSHITYNTIFFDTTAEGTWSVPVTATNAYGTGSATVTVRIHPYITGFGNTPGTFGIGDTFKITFTYNVPVSVTGPATCDFILAGTVRTASYVSGSGTTSLVLAYTFTASDAPGSIVLSAAAHIDQPVKDAAGMTAGTAVFQKYYDTGAKFDPAYHAGVAYAITAFGSSGAAANANLGNTFRATISASGPSGKPTSFAASNLPPGLGIDAASGTISGMPNTIGHYVVNVTMSGSAGSANGTVTIDVFDTPTYLINTYVGATVSYDLPASGTASVTGLPPGLGASPTGHISGTPTLDGTFHGSFTVTASTGDVRAGKLDVVVSPAAAPAITSATSVTATVGVPFSYHLTATNSPTSLYIWNTNVPELTFDTTTNTLSGTPTKAGTYDLDMHATNYYTTTFGTLHLVVSAPGTGTTTPPPATPVPAISSAGAAAGTVGVPFTYAITASNSPTSFAASPLPAGVSINPTTGVISGTPSVAGTFTASISAANAGGSGSAPLTITIAAASGGTTPGSSGGSSTSTSSTGSSSGTPSNSGGSPAGSGSSGSTSTSTTGTSAGTTQTISFTAPTVSVGQPVALSATASSGLPVTYTVVSGDATLTGTTLTVNDSNAVVVRATQAGNGSYSPATADVTIIAGAASQHVDFASPVSAIIVGQPIQLGAVASSGLPITYTVVSGPATLSGSTLTVTGTGTVVVRATQAGTATIAPASADISFNGQLPPAGRLINLSSRATLGSSDTFIAGFSVAGTSPKKILVRAIGPSLATFGIASPLPNPQLKVYDSSSAVIAQNDDWSGADVTAADSAAGAFALNAGSKDAALVLTLNPGNYTIQVMANGGAGVALAEVYDLSDAATSVPLVNISSRATVGTGENALVAGFVVGGDAPKRVLIRGVGPGLAQFGVSGTVANPQLTLYQGTTVVAKNDDWQTPTAVSATQTAATAADITNANTAAGAFALAAGSHDAAVIVTLQPGAYTAVVTTNGTAGAGLVEVYQLP